MCWLCRNECEERRDELIGRNEEEDSASAQTAPERTLCHCSSSNIRTVMLREHVCTRPPREIDFHIAYIPEGNPFKLWYSGTRMMDTTTDTIDNAPGLVLPEKLNRTCCI
jgi:hypothetical protein